MEPIIITGIVGPVSTEDGGCAKIADLDELESTGDSNFFVRLQSWSDDFNGPRHETFGELVGKKVRITVEVID